MKIKMLKTASGASGTYQKGFEGEVPDNEASLMIRVGAALAIETTAAAPLPIETTTTDEVVEDASADGDDGGGAAGVDTDATEGA